MFDPFEAYRSEQECHCSNTCQAMCSAGRSNNACVPHNSSVPRPALSAVLFIAPRGPCPADFTGICRHIGCRVSDQVCTTMEVGHQRGALVGGLCSGPPPRAREPNRITLRGLKCSTIAWDRSAGTLREAMAY